jgi:ketosteroid isomerase-like protein
MDNDEKDIRKLVDTWMAATREGNLDRVLELMAVDVVFLDGKKAKRSGHTLTILRKENGRWVLARDANLLA